jgi:SAM-dependent methyltransferase
VIAHVGGIPLEETLGLYGPALLLAGGAASASLSARLRRISRRRRARGQAAALPRDAGRDRRDRERVAAEAGRLPRREAVSRTPERRAAGRPSGDARNATNPIRKGGALSSTMSDSELKTRHRAMWASGDYPSMVETFLLPLGPRLVKACDIGPGTRVLDVAAGTGNASIPAAQRGADVTASDLTPELLDAGRRRAQAAGVQLEWVQADAEGLPFADASFEVVMSSIGAMFAPRHPDVADELVRSCRPGGRIGLLSWTPEGMIGALFRTMGPFAPPPPPGAQPPPLWGSDEHLRALFGDRVQWRTLDRDVLEVTAFERPRDYGEHFKARYGPTIAARANAVRTGREAEFDDALDRFCDDWNRGTPDRARFEMEYLLAVGTRT